MGKLIGQFSKEVQEKTFNLFSHQENAYQNYIEIPSHPSQNG
jgi:hypothetical protein